MHSFRKGKTKEDTGESGIINRKRDRKRVRMKYSALFMLSYFFFDFDEFLEASSLAASLALAKILFLLWSFQRPSDTSYSCNINTAHGSFDFFFTGTSG